MPFVKHKNTHLIMITSTKTISNHQDYYNSGDRHLRSNSKGNWSPEHARVDHRVQVEVRRLPRGQAGPLISQQPSLYLQIESTQVGWKSLILDFMERYFYLICFAAYALEHGPNNYQKSFKSWMDDHNELRQPDGFI